MAQVLSLLAENEQLQILATLGLLLVGSEP